MTDRYQIASQLGEGILGAVYLADDTMLNRRVMYRHIEYGDNQDAQKRDDLWKKKFGEYAGRLGAIQHPNMVAIYDVSIEDSGACVVSQFVEGQSLADRLEEGPLVQMGVYNMAVDMLDALHAVHESGIYHGALHTGSIKRVPRASGRHRYLLVDLGLNQLTSMVKGEKIKVADPVLMAPELHEDDQEPNAKADLFMLGQLCYTALVGGHPFSDRSSEECLDAYKSEGMPDLGQYVEGIHPDFAAWVMSLIECDPEKRPADSGAAMAALNAIDVDELEPNVAGVAHSLVEQGGSAVSAPEVLTSSQQVVVAAQTDSVYIAAANTAAAGNMEGSQPQDANATLDTEKKETAKIIYAISGLVLALIIGATMVLLRGDDEAAVTNQGIDNEHAVRIAEITTTHIDGDQGNPEVIIDLDDNKYLDWFIGSSVPISSKNRSKKDGLYIQDVTTFPPQSEIRKYDNAVKFKMGEELFTPRAAISSRKAKVGAGYEVQLKIPEEGASVITVNLYIVQKFCDIRFEVSNSQDDSVAVKVVPFSKLGVFQIPVEIDSPISGGVYTIKISIASVVKNQGFMLGCNAILIEERQLW